MRVVVHRETYPGESRVALVPGVVAPLVERGITVAVEAGAGTAAGFPDHSYQEHGADIVDSRDDLFAQADVVLQVRAAGANPEAGQADYERLRAGQVVIGLCEPLGPLAPIEAMAQRGVTLLSLELMPRITKAQSMDVLSSMATIAGYKAVLLAADALPRLFPLLMTAAGTLTAARVLVVGAGVAGLQAIATARRLGAVVDAYDVRPVVKEQVESLGARFVELELDTQTAQDQGGYAKALGEEFYRRQQELMAKVVAGADVVITTAAIPGKQAPVLVTEAMVAGMRPGSVVVDLAAERGGNCALTVAGETVSRAGVKILGPLNLPSMVATHASQMFAKNITTFFFHLLADDSVVVDPTDDITVATLLTHQGAVVHPQLNPGQDATRDDAGGTSE